MGERGGANIEIAHKLNEGEEQVAEHKSRWLEALEIIEAIVLALVAIATAWSGYQAAQWDGGRTSFMQPPRACVWKRRGCRRAREQEQMYNASAVAEWIRAQAAGNQKVAQLFERRMLPEFRPAFEAWKGTDPLNNPNAPAGPAVMPEYHNANAEAAVKRGEEATEAFEQGAAARRISDKYVRVTVVLATVLLLTVISQRFKTHSVRLGLAIVAFLLLCLPIYRLMVLPHLY